MAIVSDTISDLKTKGLEFTAVEQQRLVANLLVVICGETKVQPTYSTTSQDQGEVLEVLAGIAKTMKSIDEKTSKHG